MPSLVDLGVDLTQDDDLALDQFAGQCEHPEQGHEPEWLAREHNPNVTPMRHSGMMSQIRSVVRIELNRQTTMNTMSARK